MDPRFDDVFTSPENQIFHVVFYPDRVYHARYLNATRSSRYRYNVREVRTKYGVTLQKGSVYMDGAFLTRFMRLEYLPGRLNEVAREKNRPLESFVEAWIQLQLPDGSTVSSEVTMHFCQWVKAYQVELWGTLEPPPGTHHDFQVLDQMGRGQAVTRDRLLSSVLDADDDLEAIRQVEIAFHEPARTHPSGFAIADVQWDNNYDRRIQLPNTDNPSDDANTVMTRNYLLDFRRGWVLHEDDIEPVRYRNAMMNDEDAEKNDANVIEMQWILQRELGGSLVFFHRVVIPPGKVEGAHRHIGSEEVYYVTSGTGVAYMRVGDDPDLEAQNLPVVERQILGIGKRSCYEIPVRPGSVLFTKSGGIHGIRNASNDVALTFVAFLYHSS